MPRRLQGGGGKGGKGGKVGKVGQDVDMGPHEALATQCMGEDGRDYLRQFLGKGSTPCAASQPVQVASSCAGPIPGLETARASEASVRAAMVELRPFFKGGSSGSRGSSSMFEVGWSFHSLEKDGVMSLARPLVSFPCLTAVLREAMQLLAATDELFEARLNVICRRYTRGQGLPMHVDRPRLFDEDVYGCVLTNTTSSRLTFESKEAERIELEEMPGSCFVQRGDARYVWSHGVEPIEDGGERISVTWRWIADNAVPKGQGMTSKGKGKTSLARISQGKALAASDTVAGLPTVSKEPASNSTADVGGSIDSKDFRNATASSPPEAEAAVSIPAAEEKKDQEAAPHRRWGRRSS